MNALHFSASTALIAAMLVLAPSDGIAQQPKTSAKKLSDVTSLPETNLSRDVFSGNEARIAAMHNVSADCSTGAIPTLRILKQPKNGEIRLEEISYAVDRKAGDPRAMCNGKLVTAVGVFYKSKADFTGRDDVVIDVDFKSGTVRRFSFKVVVR